MAGARDLARGSNNAAQLANAQTTANAYFHANFPSGYLWSTNLQVNSVAADQSNRDAHRHHNGQRRTCR